MSNHIITKLKCFFNPERFQGWGKNRKYFEGWYYKIVNKDQTRAFALIPGIAIDENGMKHAFIQVLDGVEKNSEYFKFPIESFNPKSTCLDVKINNNRFTQESILLDLPRLSGKLNFANNIPWPKPFYSPGIMGPYAFAPFMECYHGIVSMDHSIKGSLKINNETINFSQGRGYIEKDWGRSFPSAYIWIQSNHFRKTGISFKISVANIPWIRNAFVGFIAGLWFENKLYRFTTYNRTKLKLCKVDKLSVEIILENRRYKLITKANRSGSTELASPILGIMDGRIEESMTSTVEVLLLDKHKKSVIFHDTGSSAALEVAGDIDEILTGY